MSYISNIFIIFVLNIVQITSIQDYSTNNFPSRVLKIEVTQMNSKKQLLFPKHLKMLEILGENIRLARKRRNLTTIQVAERANIGRNTLYLIEKGSPGVSLGAVFNVLRVLGLQDDILKLAADDPFGKKLQDIKLLGKK
jgi:DNA-binding XRE family transcriptional regulator